MDWQGDKFIADTERRIGRAVQASAIDLVNDIRRSISTPSRTVAMGKTKGGKDKKILGPRGSSRSRPGEPPHKDTGTLRSSMAQTFDPEAIKAKVGSALAVAKWMELGVRGGKTIRPKNKKALAFNGIVRKSVKQGAIAPRPFIRPALNRAKPAILERIAKAAGGRITP